jgi:hypothetical protein
MQERDYEMDSKLMWHDLRYYRRIRIYRHHEKPLAALGFQVK